MSSKTEEHMTIYCQTDSFSLVKDILSTENTWSIKNQNDSQITVSTPFGDLKITALFPEVGVGKFGNVYGGTINSIRKIPKSEKFDQQKLFDQIVDTAMILGCVVNPQFGDASDNRFSMIFKLANDLSGIVFDGFSFLEKSGALIVTMSGQTSL